MTENDKQLYQLTQGVTRIANYMHEILLLVKKDQENMQRYKEEITEKWDEPKNDLPDNINGRPYKGRL